MEGSIGANFLATWTGLLLTVLTVVYGSLSTGQTVVGTGMYPGTTITGPPTLVNSHYVYPLSVSQATTSVTSELQTTYTGGGGEGTYKMSILQSSPGTQVQVTSSGNAVVTASWTTASSTLTVSNVFHQVNFDWS